LFAQVDKVTGAAITPVVVTMYQLAFVSFKVRVK
jgi:hypothetical protein